MKHVFFTILQFLILNTAIAQVNLVPNPSFEDTSNCPGFQQYNNSSPWFSPNLASPDYFSSSNNCGYNRLTIGATGAGFQLPRSGDCYAGLYLYLPGNPIPTREYIEIKLTDSLRHGKDYQIQFHVSRANKFGLAVDAIGCYLSNVVIINSLNASNFLVQPQIENPSGNLLSDSLNWIEVSGIYNATGGENFITIGNFYDDLNTGKLLIDSSMGVSNNGYYYIDDVSVIPVDSIQTVTETDQVANISIFPNPLSKGENLTIRNPLQTPLLFELYDISGRILIVDQIKSIYLFQINSFEAGVYFIKLTSKKSKITFKLIINP